MTVSNPADSTAQAGNSYKANIDFALSVLAGAFAPHEQSTPDMTVRLEAGVIHNIDSDARTAVAAQNTATLSAPSGNPRYDIVYIDEATGTLGVATGAEAASPSDPAIPAGKFPIARILLDNSPATTTITNAILDDYRAALLTGGLKPDGDGSNLTGITAGASETDMRLAFLMIAENSGDRLNMVDGIADPFMDESDVDTATSTNETYDASGDFYHSPGGSSQIAQGTGTAIGDMTVGGGISAAFDGAINAGADSSIIVATTGYVGKDWGSGNTSNLYKYVVKSRTDGASFSGNNGGTTNLYLYGSNSAPTSATDGTLLHSNIGVTNAASVVVTVSSGITAGDYRYHWVTIINSFAEAHIAEVEFWETTTPSNVTLVSNAFTAASAPATGRIHVQVNPVDAITINTDLTAEISRDGGTTWTTSTLVLKETLADGTVAYEDDSVDISAQPTGTSMKYKIKTLNTKEVQIHGVVFQWV